MFISWWTEPQAEARSVWDKILTYLETKVLQLGPTSLGFCPLPKEFDHLGLTH